MISDINDCLLIRCDSCCKKLFCDIFDYGNHIKERIIFKKNKSFNFGKGDNYE